MSLFDDLRAIVGDANVLTGPDTAGWGEEWTNYYHWTPLCVVRPASTAEVSRVMALASATGTTVVPVGGNTSLNGGTKAEGALMLSLSRLNRVRELNVAARTVTVEAGVVLQKLRDEVDPHGLVFPLTFGAQGSAMVGGFLSTNAGGSNVLRYGNTRMLCLGIEAVLADGRVMNTLSALRKDNSGYDLRDLLIGAEGTLAVITAAVFKLSPKPVAYATALLSMSSLADALDLLNTLQAGTGGAVEAFEYMPENYMYRLAELRPDLASPFTPGKVNILVETATTVPDEDPVERLQTILADAMEAGKIADAVVASSEQQRRHLWAMREASAEVTFTDPLVIDCDVALPLDRLQTFLDRMEVRLVTIDAGAWSLVVAHLGDGNIHYSAYPANRSEASRAAIREAIAEEAVALGGTFSAEHGVGLSKRPEMAAHKDPVALDMMRAIKAALDPKGILNPGKVLP